MLVESNGITHLLAQVWTLLAMHHPRHRPQQYKAARRAQMTAMQGRLHPCVLGHSPCSRRCNCWALHTQCASASVK